MLLVAVLVAVPSVPPLSSPRASPPTTSAGGHPAEASTGPPPSEGALLAGAVPSQEPFVDVGRWVAADPTLRGGVEAVNATNRTTTAPAIVLSAAASSRGSPHPLAGGVVTGNVFDPHFGTPIPAVTVTLTPLAGGLCVGSCYTTTNSSGGFRISAPAGPATLSFNHTNYIENRTWTSVPPTGTDALGTIDLVHVGYAKGIVKYDAPGTPGASGVTLTGTSRDGLIITPGGSTAANGSFLIQLPPVPSRIDLLPPNKAVSLPNFTFAAAAPYGIVDAGVVYIENGTPLNVSFVDSVTGTALAPAGVQVCSRVSQLCLDSATAPPGPDLMRVFEPGYVVNISTLPDIPRHPAGGAFNLRPVELVPFGLINFTTGLTGGPPPAGTWTIDGGEGLLAVCSLDGLAIPVPTSGTFPWREGDCSFPTYGYGGWVSVAAPPLRDIVYVGSPSETAPLEVEVAHFATMPFIWANLTWANVTPDRAVNLSFVNFTAGAFVEGQVALEPTGVATNDFTVAICSTDEPRCLGSSSGGIGDPGCTAGPGWFCAESPPGPVEVTVTGFNGAANRTWTYVDPHCCHLAGHPIDVGWVNLTTAAGIGSISGHVYISTPIGGPQEPPAGLEAEVEICPAGPTPNGYQCSPIVVNNTTGAFNASAPLGWDRVLVIPSYYESNTTWVDVTGANSSGDIYLATPAVLAGQVLIAGGVGATEAHVSACPIGQLSLCIPIGGDGLTGSNGQYSGPVRGGQLPWGTYEVVATASGYEANWTWVNTTAGALSLVPPIRLSPIGAGAPFGLPFPTLRPTGASSGSTGSWVVGQIVDARRGYGVAGANIDACPVVGTGCLTFSDLSNSGGVFNGTVPTGAYELYVNASTFVPRTVFLNATAGTTVNLGTIDLTPQPAVEGRLPIFPWTSLATTEGLGAGASTALLCAGAGAPCGPVGIVDTGGFFNVSGPSGIGDTLTLAGGGGGPAAGDGTAPYGFTSLVVIVDATRDLTRLAQSGPGALSLAIFGGLAGTERDGGTWNTTLGEAQDPIHFGYLSSTVTGTLAGFTSCTPGGGGNYLFLEPRGGSRTTIEGTGGGFLTANVTVTGSVVAGIVVAAANVTEPHYGWIKIGLRDGTTGAPVPFASLTVVEPDPANRTNWLGSGRADGNGVANVSAPPGTDTVFISSLPYYLPANVSATVSSSRTTPLGRVNLTENPFPDTGTFYRSPFVNTVNTTPTTTAVDAATGQPLPSARVVVVSPSGGILGLPTVTNDLGQFFAFAPPPSGLETFEVQMPGYSPYAAAYNLTRGGTVVVPFANLTGDGIVAGQVLAYPSHLPVANVTVQVCPLGQPICLTEGATNGAGVFWVAAPPGVDVVTVVAEGYATNFTVAVLVRTDTWVEVGAVPVFTYATITGRLIGIPSGGAIGNGNVSVCSTLGYPAGPCFLSVSTDRNGSFVLPAPPGEYVLRYGAPLYNSSFQNLSILAGAKIDVGVVFLFAFGSIYGTVDALPNGTPIAGAAVRACATWAGGPCAGLVLSNATGRFAVACPPGPVQIDVSASGFNDNFTTVLVPVGGTAFLSSVNLTPLPSTLPLPVAGTVATSASPHRPLVGALVTAYEFGAVIASTQADSVGAFNLTLYYGTFSIVAAAPGYHPAQATVFVHSPISGLALLLATMTYPVQGVVKDRSSGAAVPSAQIAGGGIAAVTTDAAGYFKLDLANGSYDLTAEGPNGSSVAYNWVNFTIQVNGAPVRHDLSLVPSGYAILGLVVDGLTGLPIGGASVSVLGNSSTGVVVREAELSHTDGRFGLTLPPGTFAVTTKAAGYQTNRTVLSLAGAPGPVTVALAPVGGLAHASTAWESWLMPIGVGVAVAAGAGALYYLWRRRRGPTFSVPAERAESRTGGTGYRFEAPADGDVVETPPEPVGPT
ncbi:MAG: carboxypeptidase-like regulatory domain-containing protein [Thermoplasmata archaeon]|nr:carboxypeptidase-like regulatory domain-containing protein [Thermoplasmata archaeon]